VPIEVFNNAATIQPHRREDTQFSQAAEKPWERGWLRWRKDPGPGWSCVSQILQDNKIENSPVITLGERNIKHVFEKKSLGMILDEQLKWDKHNDAQCRVISNKLDCPFEKGKIVCSQRNFKRNVQCLGVATLQLLFNNLE
jgi:hypothetical protein